MLYIHLHPPSIILSFVLKSTLFTTRAWPSLFTNSFIAAFAVFLFTLQGLVIHHLLNSSNSNVYFV